MKNLSGIFIAVAAVNGFLAVAFGAFGAHGLKGRLSDDAIAIYNTGAHYHLTHAIALLAIAAMISINGEAKLLRAAGWLFTVGMILFSGSLYALAITGTRILGAITPLGGLSFLAGWACIAAYGIKMPPPQRDRG